jgi:predicted CopG family antitoxin
LNCIGVPDDVFIALQREAKEEATVAEIWKKLITKRNKVYKTFKKKLQASRLGRLAATNELSSLMKLSIGPSKWFQYTMKEALLTGFDIRKDPIMSSILHTMQLS